MLLRPYFGFTVVIATTDRVAIAANNVTAQTTR